MQQEHTCTATKCIYFLAATCLHCKSVMYILVAIFQSMSTNFTSLIGVPFSFFAFFGEKFTIIVLIFTCFRYPFFIMRIMLAAIDHNMHLFRGSKTKADGTECGHRKYSKRTKKYHAEPVKQDKEYNYFPFLIARMLKERSQFEGSFTQRTDDNAFNPKQIAPDTWHERTSPNRSINEGSVTF